MACPVCFGGDDPVVRDGLTAGISVLVAVTLVVLGGFARFIVQLIRRSRDHELAAASSHRAAE
jgi:hypothetical protein